MTNGDVSIRDAHRSFEVGAQLGARSANAQRNRTLAKVNRSSRSAGGAAGDDPRVWAAGATRDVRTSTPNANGFRAEVK
jgi:hypothetical protein